MVDSSNQAYCYHFNAVGSTIAMTDQTQTAINKYGYDPFGKIVNQVETLSPPFKFVGQHGVMIEPKGFYYIRARYYDPWVGRSVSEDHIGFEGHFLCHETNNCFCKTNKKELLSIGRKR